MKKIQLLRYCFLSLFVFTSYSAYSNLPGLGIDIYETGHIHRNGTGQLEIAVDLSKAEQLIKVVCFFAKVAPEAIQKSMQEVCSTVAKSLEGISGVHNVATAHNEKMQYTKISFQFHCIKALNKAVGKLYSQIDHPGTTYFKIDRRTFVRQDTPNLTQLIAHYNKASNAQIENVILRTIINAINYNITYSFDQKIQEVTNESANISEDRLTVFLKQSFCNTHEGNISLSNTVTF